MNLIFTYYYKFNLGYFKILDGLYKICKLNQVWYILYYIKWNKIHSFWIRNEYASTQKKNDEMC